VNGGNLFLIGTTTITNTIVSNAIDGSGIYFESNNMNSVIYSDVYNNNGGNFTGAIPAGIGQIVAVNANGDSCDIYHNIILDPLFVNQPENNFNLQSSSPCIDAGDPHSPLDPDSTIADIGAFYFDQTVGDINPPFSFSPSAFRLETYPNPFNTTVQIKFALPYSAEVKIEVFDILGREIAALGTGHWALGEYRIEWNAEGMPSGIYLVRMEAGAYRDTKKILLLK
jgi:hypothetical protein